MLLARLALLCVMLLGFGPCSAGNGLKLDSFRWDLLTEPEFSLEFSMHLGEKSVLSICQFDSGARLAPRVRTLSACRWRLEGVSRT